MSAGSSNLPFLHDHCSQGGCGEQAKTGRARPRGGTPLVGSTWQAWHWNLLLSSSHLLYIQAELGLRLGSCSVTVRPMPVVQPNVGDMMEAQPLSKDLLREHL
jgi:hypothetical protein